MQPENSEHCDQQCFSTINSANEKWRQTLAFKEAQAEIEMLRDLVSCLQQYLSEQLEQKQVLEEALYESNQELGLIDAEFQNLVEDYLFFLEEVREFVKTLSEDEKINRKVLIRLLNKVDGKIDVSKELEHIWSNMRSQRPSEKFRFLL